jgi:putative tricarboxylic transport membrane protein
MLQGLSDLGHAYLSFMNPLTLLYGLGGAFVGIVMGILPGLSATLAIALLTTLTIKLGTNDAILVLICSYVGALYGGSRTAILLNIPGTAANAASCADGYALALQGQAGRAIGIATSGAFVSTLLGVVCLALFTPLLAEVALQFGAFEFFWLALFGVTMSGSIVGGDPLKGWLMGLLGLLIAQVGPGKPVCLQPLHLRLGRAVGRHRPDPRAGRRLRPGRGADHAGRPGRTQDRRDEGLGAAALEGDLGLPLDRAALGIIGVLTGLLPGVGEDAGAWMSYAAAKAASKEPEKFGKGSIDGLMAAETGDMSSIPGHIIPSLALGIPGSAPSAVLMAAMIIHGVQPGPMLMIQHPHFIYEVVAMTTLASITILLFGLFGVRPLLHVLKVRRAILMPIVFLLCTVGAFATASRLFDVYVMLAIGIGAFFLRRRGYEMAPLVLGLVLGPLLDKSLRRGLVLSDGSILPFFSRPIAMAFAAVTIFTILLYVPPFKAAVNRVKLGRHRRRARRARRAPERGRA